MDSKPINGIIPSNNLPKHSMSDAGAPGFVHTSPSEKKNETAPSFTVSVVIRTYNRVSMLAEALDSVLRQSRPPTEILVIDDASSDETPTLMQDYVRAEKSVRYIQLKENVGMDLAGRLGVEQSSSDYIAFLDSDDLWLPTHLEDCMAETEKKPGVVMVFSAYGLMNASGQMLKACVAEPDLEHPPLLSMLYKRIVVQPTRSVVLRRAIMDVGGLPGTWVGDWVLSVLLAARFPEGIVRNSGSTAVFRIHGSQSYSRPAAMRDALLSGTEFIFTQLPQEYQQLKSRVVAINLLHSAVFLWQADEWIQGWQSVAQALSAYPLCVGMKEFWIAIGRLVVPPRLGQSLRHWKRRVQLRRPNKLMPGMEASETK